jgi:PAS domain S-box-containing protein
VIAFVSITEWTVRRSLGRCHYDVFRDLPERWKEIHRRALAGETVRADEDRWDRKHETVWVQWEIRPWKTAEGVQGGILIFAVDISRHKQMEAALRETDENWWNRRSRSAPGLAESFTMISVSGWRC